MAKRLTVRSRLTAQGQISVPAPVRRQLGLSAGSVLEWDTDADSVTVRRVGTNSSVDVHKAMFCRRPPLRGLDALKEGIRKHVRKRHARD
jgi:AbrB family looped-hinge helix DNA binding protein